MRLSTRFALLTLAALLALCSACTHGVTPTDQESTGATQFIITVTAYMPYVEEVTIPNPIYAGEEFKLTMRLSSVLEPRLLKPDPLGQRRPVLQIAGPGGNPARPDLVFFPMWMQPFLPDEGSAPESIEYTYSRPCSLPEGNWSICVQSARTRELGGTNLVDFPLDVLDTIGYGSISSPETYTGDVVYRLYPITVVKRPGT